jgi:hypothetical protein
MREFAQLQQICANSCMPIEDLASSGPMTRNAQKEAGAG